MGQLFATSGPDIFFGTSQSDLIFALANNDQVFGLAGNDTIYGGKGNDTIYGGKGDDRLFGDLGNDVLSGDRGIDTLTGGGGRDLFVLARVFTTGEGDTNGGLTQAQADLIADFTQGEDLIGLAGGLTFSNLNIFQSGADTVIQDRESGEFLAVLQGVNRNTITEADFTNNIRAIADSAPTPTPTSPTPPIVPPVRPPLQPTPPPQTAPEIEVLVNGVNITDGTTTAVPFGSTTVGTPATTTVTINNTGTAPLSLSNLVLPEGFSSVGTLPSTVAAGGTASFDVTLDADATATPSGELSFTTNDSDENPFNFQIQGTVVAAVANAFALTTDNNLVAFNTAAPGSILDTTEITGLQANESLLGIDFRPADGQLYALGSTNQIYTIDTTTGAATAVGNPLTPAVAGMGQGFDFNPVPDRIRVVNDSNQNLRLNPDTGEAIVDGTLAFAGTDTNSGVDPAIVSAAYTNSMAGATTTMLYGIDYLRDVLVLQMPPNDGVLNTVGTGLGVNVNEFTSFDIRTMGMTNEAFAAIAPDATSASSLYNVDLQTGTATLIGQIGNNLSIVGLALPIVPNAYALTNENQLLGFNTAAPQSILSTVAISGLAENESLLGIDFRPADGQLYALGSTNQIYTIDTVTGAATSVGIPLTPAVTGMGQGVDFNPVPDRIRVVNDSNQNLRLNPDTGEAIVDGTLAFAGTDTNFGVDPAIVSAAYTNSMAGATTTMLYGIDYLRDVLVLQSPPNDGILNTVGTGLGVDVNEFTSFDIRTMGMMNEAFAAISPDATSASSLYNIDLTAGTATLIGPIGNGASVTGLALPIS